MASEDTCHYRFQAIPGIFVDFATKAQKDPTFRATTLPGLGLIDKTYETGSIPNNSGSSTDSRAPWQRFVNHIEHLNGVSPSKTQYKVLFLTRHGFGYHNEYHAKYGTTEWDSHWSRLDGNGEVVWADAKLNADGIRQTNELSRFWSHAVTTDKMPLPGTIYTSPLARCLQTTRSVFEKPFAEQGANFQPTVKELLRELLTDHTCDRRSSRSWIVENYPDYVIEPELTEQDELWTGGRWETDEEHTARKQRVLEDIFSTDPNAFIGLTVHSFAISAILRAVGLPEFRVREGSTVALLVKADKITDSG